MRQLPLYANRVAPLALVEATAPLDRDTLAPAGVDGDGRNCTRCRLSERQGLRSPCMSAYGQPGGLLIVGEAPGKADDVGAKPFAGPAGQLVRQILAKHWTGPVAYDNAVKCWPNVDLKPKMFDECRPLLAATVGEVAPTRVLLLGPLASYGIFGRSVSPYSTRKGYGWLAGDPNPIPAFFLLHPNQAMRNSFVRQWFVEDLTHALTVPLDQLRHGPWQSMASIIETPEDAEQAVRELLTHDLVDFDVETIGTMWNPDFRVTAVSLCGDGDEEPFTWPEAALYDPAMRAPLQRLLESKRIAKGGQNVKYDQLALHAAFGIKVARVESDTRLLRKLIEPEAQGKLSAMAELVGMGGMKSDAEASMADNVTKLKRVVRKQWHAKHPKPLPINLSTVVGFDVHPVIDEALRAATNETLDDVIDRMKYGLLPEDQLLQYNARDSVGTARLERLLARQLPQLPHLERVWNKLIQPAANALERMEAWGIAASVPAIRSFDMYLGARETTLKKQLDVYPDVNWDSPAQVAKLFFDTLKLPPVKLTKSGKAQSTDGEVLEQLAKQHPIAKALNDYRFVTKLRGTYALGMLPHVRADGRIHPNIKLDGARSGRTSCTDPNLQNIPRAQTVEGKMARDCFVAADGFVLLEADYSQLELRIAAMLSGDEVMLEIFTSGVDYHLRTAQLVSQVAWGISPEEVTDQHRSWAKTVNFGVLYGKTAGSLAEEWGITRAKAQQIMDAILGKFAKLRDWCMRQQAQAKRTGEVFTWWDGEKARMRPLWRIADQDDHAANTAKNGAVNSPVQGTASDFCIASLVEATQWIVDDGIERDVKLCLPVHDALMFEVKRSMVSEVSHTVKAIMGGHNSNGVPLEVDFKVGPAWGSMKKLKVGQTYDEAFAQA